MSENVQQPQEVAAGAEVRGEKIRGEDIRIGVYTCQCGGNIGDVVRCRQVSEAAAKLPDVVVSRTDLSLCSDAGPGQKKAPALGQLHSAAGALKQLYSYRLLQGLDVVVYGWLGQVPSFGCFGETEVLGSIDKYA